jgi:PEGA domain-containing protein
MQLVNLLLVGLVLVGTLALPRAAIAQARGHRPPPTHPAPPVTLPQIGLPLPRLGLPPFSNDTRRVDWFHESQFPGHATGRIDWFHDRDFPGTAFARARNHGARFGAPVGRTPFVGAPVIFYVPQYVIPFAPPEPAPPPSEQIETQLTTGSLVLQVQPATAQVFIDGIYFGTPEEFDGRRGELALEPGPHRVQLVAPGYESVTVDARITANQTVRYQNVMKPVAPAPPPPPAAPIQSKTIYLVPGCYLGDVPPKDAHLPATCDVSHVVTFER